MGKLTALVSLSIALAPPTAWAQRATLAIAAPDTAVGDGTTAIDVTVALQPASALATATGFELSASAGTVGSARPHGPNAVVFSYTPPRLAADRTVQLRAQMRLGRRMVSGTFAVAVTAPVASTGSQTSAGPLGLSGPARLVIGAHSTAELSLMGAGDAPPVLTASLGAVSEPTRADTGWRATYTPPASGPPRVAVVTATDAAGAQFDWLAVPLYSAATLNLRSERFARVRVRVGDDELGPVTMDKRGRSSIAVLVPPGVPTATTTAVDAAGNERTGALQLHPPPFTRILAICPRADGHVRAIVVTPTGAPATDVDVEVDVSPGAVSDVAEPAPGVYEAAYELATVAPTDAMVTATVRISGDARATSTCTAAIPRERPSAVRAVASAATFVAGSGSAIEVEATLAYPGQMPPAVVELTAAAEIGHASAVKRGENGRYRVTWTPPNAFEGRTAATLTVTAGTGGPRADVAVALAPGPVTSLETTASRRTATGGRDAVAIAVRASDAYGNGVPGAQLVGTGPGDFDRFEDRGGGSYTAAFAPHRVDRDRAATLAVSEQASGTTSAAAVRVLASPKRFAAAATAGYVTNFGKVTAPAVSMHATARLPVWRDRVRAGADIGFYRSTWADVPDDVGPVETTVTAVPVLGRIAATVTARPVELYVGAAAGFVVAEISVEATGVGQQVESQWRPAMRTLAGAELPIGPGRAVVELGYMHATVDGDGVSGNIGGAAISVGYALDLAR